MKLLKELNEIARIEHGQLDEGILNSIFDFMWNMAGKIPSIAKKRETEQLERELADFKEKMDDATIDKWMEELSSKLKSSHRTTIAASDKRQKYLRRYIKSVKNSSSQKAFVRNMSNLHGELQRFKKFIKKSNVGVMDRKRAKKQQVNEARRQKAGSFKSRAIGNTVKINGGDHQGLTGVIFSANREHTFSAMVPFKIEYGIELPSGKRVYVRRELVTKIREKVTENYKMTKSGLLRGDNHEFY